MKNIDPSKVTIKLSTPDKVTIKLSTPDTDSTADRDSHDQIVAEQTEGETRRTLILELGALLKTWHERGVDNLEIAAELSSAGALIALTSGVRPRLLVEGLMFMLNNVPARDYAKLLCEPVGINADEILDKLEARSRIVL